MLERIIAMNDKDAEKIDHEDELRELLLLQLKYYSSDAIKEISLMNQVILLCNTFSISIID
jgi:hypothetical protein